MNYNESYESNPYESKTDERFVSTIDDPLKFFMAYLKDDGEDYMKLRFESYKEPDGEFDKEKGLIYIQKCLQQGIQRGELLNELTNCQEYYLSFPEFACEELVKQANISLTRIKEKNKSNGDDQELKLYKKIIVECVEIHKDLIANPKLNFSFELAYLIKAMHDKAIILFEKYHPHIAISISSKKYFQDIEDSTGFKLKAQVRISTMRDFYDRLIQHSYIANRDVKSFDVFFHGGLPKIKINWVKELSELKCFIDCICQNTILEKVPGQKWKKLNQIFACKGEELSPKWYRNHNLKDKKKKRLIEGIVSVLLPRQ